MKNIKIIKFVDNKKILESIEYYIALFNKKPILLMSQETSNFLKNEFAMFSPPLEKQITNIEYFYGCHIAIADWIPFGEIEIR